MSESRQLVEAQKFESGRKTVLERVETREMDNWGIEPRQWFTGKVVINKEGARERIVRLVEKRSAQKGFSADDYYDKWQMLKKAGVPVIPTVRKLDEDSVLITDLTADGSGVYGKARNFDQERTIKKGGKIQLTELDRSFLNIDLDEVEQKAFELVEIASDQKVELPYDDPFELVVHPNGSWSLITIDVRTAGKYPDQFTNRIKQENVDSVRRILMNSLFQLKSRLEGLEK